MSRQTLRKRQRGFTLVELAISTVAIGAIVAIAAGLTARGLSKPETGSAGRLLNVNATENPLSRQAIDQAIRGFYLANLRLPCPDLDDDGLENCVGDAYGALPYRSLGLVPSREYGWLIPVGYGVYKGAGAADLTTAGNHYALRPARVNPACTSSTADTACSVSAALNIASGVSFRADDEPTRNVRDVCAALSSAMREGQADSRLHVAFPGGAKSAVAYVFVLSRTPEIKTGTTPLETREPVPGLSRLRFLSEMAPVNAAQDDFHAVKSFQELFEDFRCISKAATSEGTLRATEVHIASELVMRVRQANANYMLESATSQREGAEQDVVFGALAVAITTADLIISIAEATTLNGAAIANIAVTALELANAIAAVVLAVQGRDDARDWEDEVEARVAAAKVALKQAGVAQLSSRDFADEVAARGGM